MQKRRASKETSPDEILDSSDPGDETQRNFRYQHGYGVILLVASVSKQKPYTAIWCEHFEDFLCKRSDQAFDAYQIKTRKPESGPWTLSDKHFRSSLRRFTKLVSQFGDKIADLYFISNAAFLEASAQDADEKLRRSPVEFVKAIKNAGGFKRLQRPFNNVFSELRREYACSSLDLFRTLKKLHLVIGPGRDSFDAEIVAEHLARLPECRQLLVSDLDAIRDELITKIYFASSLRIEDPQKHWVGLDENANANPKLLAKKLPVEILLQTIQDIRSRSALEAFTGQTSKSDQASATAIYICHASPIDNEFASWLALRLISEGYTVWCDLINLKGGEDYWDEVQRAISQKTAVFLYILSNPSNTAQNSLRELKIAYDVMHRDHREQFIVPLELEAVPAADLNVLLANLQTVPFASGWAKGLTLLLERLAQIPHNPQSTPATANALWRTRFTPQEVVKVKAETY